MAKWNVENLLREQLQVQSRPDYYALQYTGSDSSDLVFPHFNTNWGELQAIAKESGKPLADLGAGRSTLSAEAHLLGLEMIPVDLMEKFRADGKVGYVRTVESALSTLVEYGNVFERELLSRVREAVEAAHERHVCCDIAAMPFPARHFSVAVAHDSVPKHCHTTDVFFDKVLPEMLRVVDSHLYVYPFAKFETDGEGELVITHPLYEDQDALTKAEQIANYHGFSFELIKQKDTSRAEAPTALFRRFHNEDLSHGNL